MQKIIFIISFIVLFCNNLFGQKDNLVFSDIDNFWIAYDKIVSTNDTLLKRKYLKEFYLDKGTIGLKSLLQVRNYTENEYLEAINKYPKFWVSLKKSFLDKEIMVSEIGKDIQKLKKIYPNLSDNIIYFAIGVFRTGGTAQDNRVLIGCENSFVESTTFIDEHPQARKDFYRDFKPKENVALLCVHEYVHTQQKDPVNSLLAYCLYEGVAEFVSCLATAKKSNTPSIAFGQTNSKKVLDKFAKEVFFNRRNEWLWGENTNELKIRDLGYYIGYEICERYYNMATNKEEALKELIELDYTKNEDFERIIDKTKIFPKKLKKMREEYEKIRPTVKYVKPLKENNGKIKPGITQLEITFSEEMDINFRGFDFGPLGESAIYRFKKLVGWANNNKTIIIEVETDPHKKYQAYITSTFRSKKGAQLVPFLMEFETKE